MNNNVRSNKLFKKLAKIHTSKKRLRQPTQGAWQEGKKKMQQQELLSKKLNKEEVITDEVITDEVIKFSVASEEDESNEAVRMRLLQGLATLDQKLELILKNLKKENIENITEERKVLVQEFKKVQEDLNDLQQRAECVQKLKQLMITEKQYKQINDIVLSELANEIVLNSQIEVKKSLLVSKLEQKLKSLHQKIVLAEEGKEEESFLIDQLESKKDEDEELEKNCIRVFKYTQELKRAQESIKSLEDGEMKTLVIQDLKFIQQVIELYIQIEVAEEKWERACLTRKLELAEQLRCMQYYIIKSKLKNNIKEEKLFRQQLERIQESIKLQDKIKSKQGAEEKVFLIQQSKDPQEKIALQKEKCKQKLLRQKLKTIQEEYEEECEEEDEEENQELAQKLKDLKEEIGDIGDISFDKKTLKNKQQAQKIREKRREKTKINNKNLGTKHENVQKIKNTNFDDKIKNKKKSEEIMQKIREKRREKTKINNKNLGTKHENVQKIKNTNFDDKIKNKKKSEEIMQKIREKRREKIKVNNKNFGTKHKNVQKIKNTNFDDETMRNKEQAREIMKKIREKRREKIKVNNKNLGTKHENVQKIKHTNFDDKINFHKKSKETVSFISKSMNGHILENMNKIFNDTNAPKFTSYAVQSSSKSMHLTTYNKNFIASTRSGLKLKEYLESFQGMSKKFKQYFGSFQGISKKSKQYTDASPLPYNTGDSFKELNQTQELVNQTFSGEREDYSDDY